MKYAAQWERMAHGNICQAHLQREHGMCFFHVWNVNNLKTTRDQVKTLILLLTEMQVHEYCGEGALNKSTLIILVCLSATIYSPDIL